MQRFSHFLGAQELRERCSADAMRVVRASREDDGERGDAALGAEVLHAGGQQQQRVSEREMAAVPLPSTYAQHAAAAALEGLAQRSGGGDGAV